MERATYHAAEPNRHTEASAEPERWRDAVTLWREVYGDGPGFVALFSGMRPTPTAPLTTVHEAYFTWPRETTAATRWLEEQSEQDRELYHCAHLVRRWRRRKQDAMHVHALWVDLDGPLPETLPLAPSHTVESSPDRYQLYFRLSHAITPGQAAALNRGLAQLFGADMGGWDLTQLLRVPGSVNHKYPEQPTVRLVEATNRVYAPEELPAVAPVTTPAPRGQEGAVRPEQRIRPVGDAPPVPLTKAALQLWQGEGPFVKRTAAGEVDRSAALVQIARLLAAAKLPEELILAHLAERDAALFGKYSDRADSQTYYTRIIALVARGTPTRRQS
jgi:hypothetical protein